MAKGGSNKPKNVSVAKRARQRLAAFAKWLTATPTVERGVTTSPPKPRDLPDVETLLGQMTAANPHGFTAGAAIERTLEAAGFADAESSERRWGRATVDWRFGRSGAQPDPEEYRLSGGRLTHVVFLTEHFLAQWQKRFGSHYYSRDAERPDAAREPFKVAGGVLAAVAGSAGYLYLVGGVVSWLRLRALELPADDVVAAIPREQLLVTGLAAVVVPVLLGGGAAAVLVSTRLSSLQFSIVFSAFALGWALIETAPGQYAIPFVVIAALIMLPTSLLVLVDLIQRARGRGSGDGSGFHPRWELFLYLGLLLPMLVLAPTLVLGSTLLTVVITASLILSFFAGNWLQRARSTSARLTRGALVTVAIALAFRIVTEFEPPSPLQPAVLYSSATQSCRVVGQENAADKGRRFSPCRLAGYLLASSESAIYLAPAREKGARVSPSEEPKLTGGVVRIPADAVIELRTRAPTAVSRPEPDGQDDGPVQPLLK